MRHLIVVCLAFMMGLNVACSRVEDLGKDDLHSEPTIEIVSGDTLDIVGFTLAHELATSEGRLPYNVGDEFGYTGSYTYKSYVVRTEYTYQDDGNSIWVWEDTLSSIIGFYPYLRSEVYDLADVQFHIRGNGCEVDLTAAPVCRQCSADTHVNGDFLGADGTGSVVFHRRFLLLFAKEKDPIGSFVTVSQRSFCRCCLRCHCSSSLMMVSSICFGV